MGDLGQRGGRSKKTGAIKVSPINESL